MATATPRVNTPPMLTSLAYVLPTLLVLLLAQRALHRLCARAVGDGGATRIVVAAETFGTFLIAAAAAGSVRGESLLVDLQWLAVFGLGGMLAFELAAWAGVRALAHGGLAREIRAGNVAAATLTAGHVLATGILAASLFRGTSWDDLLLAAGFFALSQVSLHALVWLFRALTTYDDEAKVMEHNVAAGLAHAGVSVAMALLIAHAGDGAYVDLATSLGSYALALGEGLAFYVVRQLLVSGVLLGLRPTLRGGALDRAIGERADVGAGALEAASYVAMALVVRSLG